MIALGRLSVADNWDGTATELTNRNTYYQLQQFDTRFPDIDGPNRRVYCDTDECTITVLDRGYYRVTAMLNVCCLYSTVDYWAFYKTPLGGTAAIISGGPQAVTDSEAGPTHENVMLDGILELDASDTLSLYVKSEYAGQEIVIGNGYMQVEKIAETHTIKGAKYESARHDTRVGTARRVPRVSLP